MQVGLWLPSRAFDVTPAELVAFARDAEAAGFDFLAASDHVLTTRLPADHRSATMMATGYLDPFTMFAALAGTVRIGFSTSVLVLAQRQAALVARQMSDLLWWHGDRFRFGVGSGWNPPEFAALGVPFERRGAILSEQVGVIEALWSERFATFEGDFHRLEGVGLDPWPAQPRPPLWFGGHGERVLRRVRESGAGWMPLHGPDHPTVISELAQLREALDADGRPPGDVGLDGRLALTRGGPEAESAATAEGWRALGATHLTITYEGGGFRSLAEALDAASGVLARVKG
jgi:probable F420-dependent oxidoreductase